MKNVPFEIQRIGVRRGGLAINLESLQYLVDKFNERGGEQITLSVKPAKKVKSDEPVVKTEDSGEGGDDTSAPTVADSKADPKKGVSSEARRSDRRATARRSGRGGSRRGK